MRRVWWLTTTLAALVGVMICNYEPPKRIIRTSTSSSVPAPESVAAKTVDIAPSWPPDLERTISFHQAQQDPEVWNQFLQEFALLDDRVDLPDYATVVLVDEEVRKTLPDNFFSPGVVARTRPAKRGTKLGGGEDIIIYFLPKLFRDASTQNEYDVASWFLHEIKHAHQYHSDVDGIPWGAVPDLLQVANPSGLIDLMEVASLHAEIEHPNFQACSPSFQNAKAKWYLFHYSNLLRNVSESGSEVFGARYFTECAFGSRACRDIYLPGEGWHYYEIKLDPTRIVADGEEIFFPESVAPRLEYFRDLR